MLIVLILLVILSFLDDIGVLVHGANGKSLADHAVGSHHPSAGSISSHSASAGTALSALGNQLPSNSTSIHHLPSLHPRNSRFSQLLNRTRALNPFRRFHWHRHAVVRRHRNGRILRSRAARSRFLKGLGLARAPSGYEVDHIEPLYAGGKDHESNMQLLSSELHREKTKQDRGKYKHHLRRPAGTKTTKSDGGNKMGRIGLFFSKTIKIVVAVSRVFR